MKKFYEIIKVDLILIIKKKCVSAEKKVLHICRLKMGLCENITYMSRIAKLLLGRLQTQKKGVNLFRTISFSFYTFNEYKLYYFNC